MHKYWIKWHWRHDFTQLAAPAFPRGRKEHSVNGSVSQIHADAARLDR